MTKKWGTRYFVYKVSDTKWEVVDGMNDSTVDTFTSKDYALLKARELNQWSQGHPGDDTVIEK